MFNYIRQILKMLRHPADPNWHIEKEARSSKSHPFGGFWKTSLENDHGLAIGPADDGKYFISFCGPGGCIEKGVYRQNSSLDGDKNYLIIDSNTIDVKGKKGFTRYYRTNSRA
jgi:hypothetical protein